MEVGQVGGGHVPGDGLSQGIDQEAPFPALHALVRVVAADVCRFLNGLHALRIHDRGARVRISAHALAFGGMQGTV